jgi:hypothetical protein
MPYSEQDGQVVLTMSKEDYDYLLANLIAFRVFTYQDDKLRELLNRLNSGNPNYTPYQVEEKK